MISETEKEMLLKAQQYLNEVKDEDLNLWTFWQCTGKATDVIQNYLDTMIIPAESRTALQKLIQDMWINFHKACKLPNER